MTQGYEPIMGHKVRSFKHVKGGLGTWTHAFFLSEEDGRGYSGLLGGQKHLRSPETLYKDPESGKYYRIYAGKYQEVLLGQAIDGDYLSR